MGSAIITIPVADLSVNKTVDDLTPNESDPVVFTLVATNSGPDSAQSVEVLDLLPSGVTYGSDNGGGAYDPVSGIWDIGSFAPGAKRQIRSPSLRSASNTMLPAMETTMVDPAPMV